MRASRWLGLAAAPTFAVMALTTGLSEARASVTICGPVPDGSPLGGMTLMYLLMTGFHLGPWLKAASRQGASLEPAPHGER